MTETVTMWVLGRLATESSLHTPYSVVTHYARKLGNSFFTVFCVAVPLSVFPTQKSEIEHRPRCKILLKITE